MPDSSEVPAVLTSATDIDGKEQSNGDGQADRHDWREEVLEILRRLDKRLGESEGVLTDVQDRLGKVEKKMAVLIAEMKNTNQHVAEWSTRCLNRCEALDALLGGSEPTGAT
jgi:hypothetical protein